MDTSSATNSSLDSTNGNNNNDFQTDNNPPDNLLLSQQDDNDDTTSDIIKTNEHVMDDTAVLVLLSNVSNEQNQKLKDDDNLDDSFKKMEFENNYDDDETDFNVILEQNQLEQMDNNSDNFDQKKSKEINNQSTYCELMDSANPQSSVSSDLDDNLPEVDANKDENDDDDNENKNSDDDPMLMQINTFVETTSNDLPPPPIDAKFDPMEINDLSSFATSDDKKRLRLEDFMRQIISQINNTTEKIWPNLLLDFTKNFSELNMPTYVLQMNKNFSNIGYSTNNNNNPGSNNDNNNPGGVLNCNRFVSNSDQDLLMDILNIAISSLSLTTDRRVFACQLLLNIHDCLTMDTIESKVMPLLTEIVENEPTTSVRFTVCFVLANYARRVEFDYFRNTIFPLFQKLSFIALERANDTDTSDQHQQFSLCTSTTICFALLDSLTSLLSYLLHFNQMLMKKPHTNKNDGDEDEDEDMLINYDGDGDDKSTKTKDINHVFSFIHQEFLPLLKQIFQKMLNYIDQYRNNKSIKIEQDLFNCFLHWRDQIGTHDSISQTLFSHYQSLVLFVLILRDFLHASDCDQTLCDLIDHDKWYLNFYYQLCAFHYVMPKSYQQLNPTMTATGSSAQQSTNLKDSLLIDQSTHSILTKINLMDLGKNNPNNNNNTNQGDSSNLMNTTATSTAISNNSSQNFIGRFQVKSDNHSIGNGNSNNINKPSSILQQQLQQPMTNNSTATTTSIGDPQQQLPNVSLQENDFSIGSTQYTFSPNALNNFDIFGFFRFKTIACKMVLVSLVPAISDFYYINKNSNLFVTPQQQQIKVNIENSNENNNNKFLQSTPTENQQYYLSEQQRQQLREFDNLTANNFEQQLEKGETNLNVELNCANNNCVNSAVEEKEQIITNLIDILNTLSIDNNYEISIKMSNIIEKLVERFTEPIRLYSLLTNLLQSQNFDVIGNAMKNFYSVFSSMLTSSQNNPNTKTIIEYVIETFLRSESYLSTKPKWRLHILYFDVLFRLSRMVPVDIVKRLIIPRLLLRFSTTRAIPCRQAVARCLLLVYIENFAQHDFEKFYYSTETPVSTSNANPQKCSYVPVLVDDNNSQTPAQLSFDLFNWLDRNLKQSVKYQDRQIFIDVISILLKFLFRDSIDWQQQQPTNNHYMVDLQELCPCLMDTQHLWHRFSKESRTRNLKDLNSSQLFAMLLIQRYQLLHLITEMACKDRVSTIRASACTVLYSMLQCTNHWVVNNLHRLPCQINEQNHLKKEDYCLESIMEYYDSYMESSEDIDTSQYTSEQLYRRLQTETDAIVLEELNKVFLLADDYRLDFSLNYYQLRNKRKKQRKDEDEETVTATNDNVSTVRNNGNIDADVIELVNDLLMYIESMDDHQTSNYTIRDQSSNEDDEGIDLNDDLILNEVQKSEMDKNSISSNSRCRGLIYISNNEIEQSKNSTIFLQEEKKTESELDRKKDTIIKSDTAKVSLDQQQQQQQINTSSPKKRKSPKHIISNNSNISSSKHQTKSSNTTLNKNCISTCQSSKINNANDNNNKTVIGQGLILVDNSSISAAVAPLPLPLPLSSLSNNNNNRFKSSLSVTITPNQKLSKNSSLIGSNRKQSHHPTPTTTNRTSSVALLPTPTPGHHHVPTHNHHHSLHHSSSKVPVLNNNNNNKMIPTAQSNSVVAAGNTATAPAYPGTCFRIVYPQQAPPPPPPPPGAFFAANGIPSLQQRSTGGLPSTLYSNNHNNYNNHYHQTQHHHHATGSAFSKLPKTVSSVSGGSISFRPVSTSSTNKNKWTPVHNTNSSNHHHYNHNNHQHLNNRSLSVPPTTSNTNHQSVQLQPGKIAINQNRKIFRTSLNHHQTAGNNNNNNNSSITITSSTNNNCRQIISSSNNNNHISNNIISNKNNHNNNNNNFMRVKKLKKKLETFKNLSVKNNNNNNNDNTLDSMETDDSGNNNNDTSVSLVHSSSSSSFNETPAFDSIADDNNNTSNNDQNQL